MADMPLSPWLGPPPQLLCSFGLRGDPGTNLSSGASNTSKVVYLQHQTGLQCQNIFMTRPGVTLLQ